MDGLHSLLKGVDHNRWLIVGLIVAVALSSLLIGCVPKTASILYPDRLVTAAELEREAVQIQGDAEAQLAQLELARADLQRQAELRAKVIEIAGGLGTSLAAGQITPAAGIAAVIQLLALAAAGGAIADNRRKDKKITELKNGTKPPA